MAGMRDKDIQKEIPEIINGAKLLFDKDFTYQKAIDTYSRNLKYANIRKNFKKTQIENILTFLIKEC